jgi:hypothetical protein
MKAVRDCQSYAGWPGPPGHPDPSCPVPHFRNHETASYPRFGPAGRSTPYSAGGEGESLAPLEPAVSFLYPWRESTEESE